MASDTPCWIRSRPLSAHYRGGEASVLDRSGVGFPIRHSTHEKRQRKLDQISGSAVNLAKTTDAFETGSSTGAGSERLARLPSLAVTDAHAFMRKGHPPSRDCHRADMVPIRREEETSVVSHLLGRVESSR